MKALVYSSKEKAARFVEAYAKPQIKRGESLVRIVLAAVCNTDKEILRGYKADFSGVMGHEFVSVVEESDDDSLVGKRVVGELNEGCGTCLYCKTGREHHCEHRRVIGIAARDGAFAQYMSIATRLLHIVPEGLANEKAVYTEPLAAALRIAEQVHLSPNKNAAVIGDGRLAYLIAQVLALSGIEVTVFGRHAEKLRMFDSFAITSTEQSGSFEVVIDAAGGPSGIAAAQKLVRREGTVVLKSTYAGEASIDMSYFVVNEIQIIGSRCGPFAPALHLLERGMITLPDVQLYALHDWQAAFNDKESFKTGFKMEE